MITESDETPVDVVQTLKDTEVDVLVCYLPVGSEQAAKFYAQCAIDAKVAFVNALPVFIAGPRSGRTSSRDAGVPIVGDDIKSQIGATITHRVLAKLFEDRGVTVDRTYQLNVGGNMDFMNMLERERLESKKISKTQSVTSQLRDDDRRRATCTSARPTTSRGSTTASGRSSASRVATSATSRSRSSTSSRCGTPRTRPASSSTRSAPRRSPRTAASAARSCRPSSYFMKSPPEQYSDDDAQRAVEDFIAGEDRALSERR